LFKNFRKVNHVDDDGKYAELLSIGVLPEKNGLGIGKKLLIKFENKVREKGINTITLTTDLESNDNVLNFYKKCGYKVYYDFITFPNRKMLKLIKELEK
jgi:ribosomal protein S18 acetylase RimI-like enzyme